MAHMNEPRRETVRITSPPPTTQRPIASVEKEAPRINLPNQPPGVPESPAGVKPSSGAPLRPPLSVAPRPLPPPEGSASVRPPGPPSPRPAAAPPGGVRPPPLIGTKAPAPPPGGLASVSPPSGGPRPPVPPGAKSPLPPAPVGGKFPLPPAPKPPFPAGGKPPENRGVAQTGQRNETGRIADTPMKAAVKLGVQPGTVPTVPVIWTASLADAVANPPAQGLVESVPRKLCWALLSVSTLTLLIQIWTYFS